MGVRLPRRAGRCRVPASCGAEGRSGRDRTPTASCAGSRPSARRWRRWTIRTSRGCWTAGTTAGRPAVLRDGVRRRRADRSLLRRAAAADRRAAASCFASRLRRRPVRAREPGGAPRHQAGQHPGDARTARRSCSTSASPSWSRDGRAHRGRAAAAATWLMTPDYASPEQLGGRASTIATDVYSLGVLLYVLLTGDRPYRAAVGRRRLEIERELLDERAGCRRAGWRCDGPSRRGRARPAAARHRERLARRLAGDLDAIVLRAMGREPASRYSSVGADHARTWSTTGGAIRSPHASARRATSPDASSSAICTALGVAAALAARHHRRRRRRAVAGGAGHRGPGARRAAVRRTCATLAGSFMFEVYDALDDVPGTTPARELIVQKAVAVPRKPGRGNPPATPASSRSWRARSCAWATCRATRRRPTSATPPARCELRAGDGDRRGACGQRAGRRRCAADAGAGPPAAARDVLA